MFGYIKYNKEGGEFLISLTGLSYLKLTLLFRIKVLILRFYDQFYSFINYLDGMI